MGQESGTEDHIGVAKYLGGAHHCSATGHEGDYGETEDGRDSGGGPVGETVIVSGNGLGQETRDEISEGLHEPRGAEILFSTPSLELAPNSYISRSCDLQIFQEQRTENAVVTNRSIGPHPLTREDGPGIENCISAAGTQKATAVEIMYLQSTGNDDVAVCESHSGLIPPKQMRVAVSNSFEMLPLSTISDPGSLDCSRLNPQEVERSNISYVSRSFEQREKGPLCEPSLRHVLSDPDTGAFMDDAMVAQCGHSFGNAGLQRVKDTKVCTSCGADVLPETLVPNLVLQAAIQAYKREDIMCQLNLMKGTKRAREDLEECVGSHMKRTSRVTKISDRAMEEHPGTAENSCQYILRPKKVHFPFEVNCKVRIKGNKRTPERFVGREAIITSQCLNGWYLVRTLDNGESVRLQYRSLQKLGDVESPLVSEKCVEACAMDVGSSDPTSDTKVFICSKIPRTADTVEVVTLVEANPTEIAREGFERLEEFANSISGNQALMVSKLMEAADEFEESKRLPATSIEPSSEDVNQVLHSVQGKANSMEVWVRKDTGLGDTQILSTRSPMMEVSSRGGGAVQVEGEEQECGGLCASLVNQSGPNLRGMPIKSTPTTGPVLEETDPYRKVFSSMSRKRGTKAGLLDTSTSGHSQAMMMHYKPLIIDGMERQPAVRKAEDDQEQDPKLKSAKEILQILKRDMLKLEKKIPWTCLLKCWRESKTSWRQGVETSQTIQELGVKVQDFRSSLLLNSAGGMPDEEWEMRMASIMTSEDVELLVSLWGRLCDDVVKWLESRAKLVKGKRLHPNWFSSSEIYGLCGKGAISSVSIATAAALATADAVADGHQDPKTSLKVLLKSTMKLLQQQSREDLISVREALEREKRHITAKLAHLEESFSELEGMSHPAKLELEGCAIFRPVKNTSDTFETSIPFSEILRETDAPVSTSKQGDETDEEDSDIAMIALAADGEATDLSDSD